MPSTKRAKLDFGPAVDEDVVMKEPTSNNETASKSADLPPKKVDEEILPPSHALLGIRSPGTGESLRVMESDVGISEYISHNIPSVNGIIKQSCVS